MLTMVYNSDRHSILVSTGILMPRVQYWMTIGFNWRDLLVFAQVIFGYSGCQLGFKTDKRLNDDARGLAK